MRDLRKEKYEAKINELRSEVEKQARLLGDVEQQRDSAIHARETAVKEISIISDQIVLKKEELSKIEATLVTKNKEADNQSKDLLNKGKQLTKEVLGLEFRKKTLTKSISEANIKVKALTPLVEKYDSTLKELEVTTKKVIEAKLEFEENTVKARKVLEEARNIREEVKKQKSENEEWFRRLQSYETALNFYAERLRRWYQGKGLRLPVEYEPEKIREKVTQNG